uniref:Ribosomal protein L29 n=1 Tax=Chondria tumulosa TaxID=2740715 RepID=A0A896SVY9_9FLOR|nr:ribosomal protein L29 [Chondria tumulosa]QSD57150.1 ribosomal protein L29 [Chondria tumulosa]
MKINKKLNSINDKENKNIEIFNLQKQLVLLRIKQKTKQNTKTHLFKKIRNQISQILILK